MRSVEVSLFVCICTVQLVYLEYSGIVMCLNYYLCEKHLRMV